MKLIIGVIFPEILNMFGDKGNVKALVKRLEWRGIESEVKEFNLNDEINLEDIDIIYIGGGGDKEIKIARDKLISKSDELKNYIENNGVLLAVCSGFELISKEFYQKGEKQEGLNLLDVASSWNDKRFVSNVVIDTPFGVVAGFENHNGRMNIGTYKPLGTILCGNGNNGEDKKEGVLYKNTFATYLDGPVLPKNPELCDEIIKRAILNKDETFVLKKLDDSKELIAKNYVIEKYTK